MIFRSACICAIVLFGFGSLKAEFRTFTNDFGDTVEAELIELKEDGSIVEMRLKNGRKIDASLTAFSQKDKKYIREWWKKEEAEKQILNADDRLVINAKMNTKSRSTGYNSWYSDESVKSFFPEVIIENKELQGFKGNEVRVVVFAQDMAYKDQILVVSAMSSKTEFKEQDQTVLETEPFRLRHYEYDSSYSNYEYEYGYRYTGYAITIKNSEGEVTHEKATKSKFLNPKFLYKCKSGEIYDSKFEHKLKSYPNSYYVQ